jgi:hypothetical protein
MSGPQIVSLVFALAIMATLFELLRRHRLREKYALIWSTLSVAAIIGALFPGLLGAVSTALGLQLPSNLLFLLAIVVLLGLTLQLSYELGRSEERVRTLAEEVALLRLRIDEALREIRDAEQHD